jgi:hypothetical protein
MNILRSFLLLVISACSFPSITTHWFVGAYRVGDVVDAAMYTKSFPVELFMANMPLFGVSRRVKMPRLMERFSLAFEEGLHSLPFMDAQTLEKLQIKFIYSRSGEGRIHSVTSEAIRSKVPFNAKTPIEVEFEWIEEEAVNLDAGLTIVFLATLVASITFLIQLCGAGGGVRKDSNHDMQSRSVSNARWSHRE